MKFASEFKRLIIFLSVLAAIGFLVNCRKIDFKRDAQKKMIKDHTKKFFFVPASTEPIVRAVSDKIKRQNDQYHFVNDLAERVGLPVWDKSIVVGRSSHSRNSTSDSLHYVYIPFADNTVNATLIGRVTASDTLLFLLNAGQYKYQPFDSGATDSLWTARNMFHLFAFFENEIYGHKLFKITDDRLFPSPDTTMTTYARVNPGESSGRNTLLQPITMCFETDICYATPQQYFDDCLGECDETCEYWVRKEEDCVQTLVESGWTGGQPPYVYGGGYTDNNGIWWPDYCEGNNYCSQPGWEPAVGTDEDYDVQNSYDTIGISDALRDVYPCAYAYIHDSIASVINIDILAQIAGAAVFRDSVYMHITFDTSTTLTQQGQAAGITIPSTAPFVDDSGVSRFAAVIKLNGWYLRNGTKEFMQTTIIHEIMHAVLMLRWGQYYRWLHFGQGTIDSSWMKAHYPSQWYWLTNQGINLTALQHHLIMATDYLELFQNIAARHWNPAATVAQRDSVITGLSYAGLKETTVWKNLPALGRDTCKYAGIQISAEISNTGTYAPGGCSSAYSFHYGNDLKMRPGCN